MESPRLMEPSTSARNSLNSVVSLDAELTRGVPVSEVLRSLGKLLGSSRGPADNFQLSRKTADGLQEFLSHNWSTGRAEKFLTLAIHYHIVPAVAAAWSVGALAAGLTIAGYLPWFDIRPASATCLNAWLSGHLAFAVVFLFAQDLRRLLAALLPLGPHLVFLDKACIDQQDAARQRRGIENLAGFLRISQSMVVVYSPVYLKRLWTVYELASFMLLHQDSSRIVVLPVTWAEHFGLLVLGFFTLSTLHWIAFFASMELGLSRTISAGLYAGMGLLVAHAWACSVRRWQRHLADMEETIRHFSIKSAVCSVEADRALVEGNICTFMRCLGWASSREEALSRFDEAVRVALPHCLEASVRGRGYPYWMAAAAGMSFVLVSLDHFAAEVCAGSGAVQLLAKVAYSLLLAFGVVPLGVALTNWLLSRRLGLRGPAERCWCFLCMLPSQGLSTLDYVLLSAANRSEGAAARRALAALLAYGAVLLACTFCFYRRVAKPAPRLSWCDREETASTAAGEDTASTAEAVERADSQASGPAPVLAGLPASRWRGREVDGCRELVEEVAQLL